MVRRLGWVWVVLWGSTAFAQDAPSLVGQWTLDQDAMVEVAREAAEAEGREFSEQRARVLLMLLELQVTFREDGTYTASERRRETTGIWSLEEVEEGWRLTLLPDEGEDGTEQDVGWVEWIDADHYVQRNEADDPAPLYFVRVQEE